ncbi:MAG: protease modulator HflC [Treponema sp.]|jgi:membrane protease subunit HflC|nr:protease modulator HflC [Treponema sp.]
MNKLFKFLFVLIFIILVLAAGFTFTVREGSTAIVSRFGRIASVHTDAGLHFRLPWPVDRIITYDSRNQYMDSGLNEALTNDKFNIILQVYLVWNIKDAQRFHTSVGDYTAAQRHLNGIVANTKNGVLGNYMLSNLVSTNPDDIMLDEIRGAIEQQVAQSALNNFGIEVQALRIRRLALPYTNVLSVFDQMIADRQRYVSRYLTEGERDAAIIISEAEARAAEIIAQGRLEASEIEAETERRVAQIYGEAYDRNSRLFTFLKNLIALENSVNPDTVIIMRASESPFNVITR